MQLNVCVKFDLFIDGNNGYVNEYAYIYTHFYLCIRSIMYSKCVWAAFFRTVASFFLMCIYVYTSFFCIVEYVLCTYGYVSSRIKIPPPKSFSFFLKVNYMRVCIIKNVSNDRFCSKQVLLLEYHIW